MKYYQFTQTSMKKDIVTISVRIGEHIIHNDYALSDENELPETIKEQLQEVVNNILE